MSAFPCLYKRVESIHIQEGLGAFQGNERLPIPIQEGVDHLSDPERRNALQCLDLRWGNYLNKEVSELKQGFWG